MNAASYITIYADKAASAAARAAIETDARNKDFLLREARKYTNLSQGARESAAREAAAQPVAVEAPKVEAKPVPVKDIQRVKAMRRFFAIAKDAGLDTSKGAKPRMRHAIENLLRRCFDSRAEITTEEWIYLGDLINSGRLNWD